MTRPGRPDLPTRMAALLQRSTRARAAASAALHRAERALEVSSQCVAAATPPTEDVSRPARSWHLLTEAQRATLRQALLEQAQIDGQVKNTTLRYPHLARAEPR